MFSQQKGLISTNRPAIKGQNYKMTTFKCTISIKMAYSTNCRLNLLNYNTTSINKIQVCQGTQYFRWLVLQYNFKI